MTETTPPTPPAQPATPGQPAGAPDARPAPGVHHPIPGQPMRPPLPPTYYPPPRPGFVVVPLGPGGKPLASFADRLVAFIIDAVILGGVALIFVVPMLIWWFRTFAETVTTMETSVNRGEDIPSDFFSDLFVGYFALFGVAFALGMILSYVYQVEMSWRSGQTIGKRVMKLQITPVAPDEERSRMMFVKRWAVERVAGSLVPFFSYLDGLWQLWDKPLQQCLHDKAARTVVVKIG